MSMCRYFYSPLSKLPQVTKAEKPSSQLSTEILSRLTLILLTPFSDKHPPDTINALVDSIEQRTESKCPAFHAYGIDEKVD